MEINWIIYLYQMNVPQFFLYGFYDESGFLLMRYILCSQYNLYFCTIINHIKMTSGVFTDLCDDALFKIGTLAKHVPMRKSNLEFLHQQWNRNYWPTWTTAEHYFMNIIKPGHQLLKVTCFAVLFPPTSVKLLSVNHSTTGIFQIIYFYLNVTYAYRKFFISMSELHKAEKNTQ